MSLSQDPLSTPSGVRLISRRVDEFLICRPEFFRYEFSPTGNHKLAFPDPDQAAAGSVKTIQHSQLSILEKAISKPSNE
jgi:hypothetical protein